jgi:hypothetical protein
MWVANVGMLGPAIFDYERWKFWKKVFNLIRNYTQLIRAILLYKINARKLQKQKNELDKYDNQLCGTQNYKVTECMRHYIS